MFEQWLEIHFADYEIIQDFKSKNYNEFQTAEFQKDFL